MPWERPHGIAIAVRPLPRWLAMRRSQLCGDGTAAVASDAYYARVQQECVARSAEPHSGACHALLRQQSLGRTATRPRVRAGHIDLRSSGIYTSSAALSRADFLHGTDSAIYPGQAPPPARGAPARRFKRRRARAASLRVPYM